MYDIHSEETDTILPAQPSAEFQAAWNRHLQWRYEENKRRERNELIKTVLKSPVTWSVAAIVAAAAYAGLEFISYELSETTKTPQAEYRGH
jgi:RecB family exonuclease